MERAAVVMGLRRGVACLHAGEQRVEQRELGRGADQVLAFYKRLGLGAFEEVPAK